MQEHSRSRQANIQALPRTRAEAKAYGSVSYFTGLPCKHGHVSQRQTSNGVCEECRLIIYHKWRNGHVAEENKRCKEWRRDNKQLVLDAKKKWALSNPDKMREMYKRKYKKDIEKSKKQRNNWYKNNKEKFIIYGRNRRAKNKSASGKHDFEDIKRIKNLQNGKCAYCAIKLSKKYHVDHIYPLSKGGSNWANNLQILCPSCNLNKHAKHPIDYAREIGLLL